MKTFLLTLIERNYLQIEDFKYLYYKLILKILQCVLKIEPTVKNNTTYTYFVKITIVSVVTYRLFVFDQGTIK